MRAPSRSLVDVLANDDLGGGNFRLRLDVGAGWPAPAAGQFVMLSAGAVTDVSRDDPLLPRPMAIYRSEASAQGGRLIDVVYKVVGRGTALMRAVSRGERMRLVGPLGCGFAHPDPGIPAVLVGGGTGIASLYDLASGLCGAHRVTVLLGAQTGASLLGREDFAGLAVDLQVATDDGSLGSAGLVTELLGQVLDAQTDAIAYACGPTAMMRAAAKICADRRIPCQVSLENHMACGVGICLGCAVPLRDAEGFLLVCRDGPVFPSDALAWAGLL